MPVVLIILALAALTWWAVYAQRCSLWAACAGFAAVGYVFGPPLLTVRAGPLPLTVDRLLLVGLCGVVICHWRLGRLRVGAMTGFDWLLIALVGYLTVRCALTPEPPADGSSVKPWWRLISAFWIPAAVYFAARSAPASERSWRVMLWILTALGTWLSFTAFAEIGRQWWAVFPRYIADPTLGTHFGRARGPALNSASLGVFVTICFWAAWMVRSRLSRPAQLAVMGALVAMAAAVYFTYTRSTWLGLAAGLVVVPWLQLPRQWRGVLAVGALTAAVFGIAVFGERITNLSRKDSDASAEHSVYQRASFVYVSMRMFYDAPIFGCGFGRFYDLKEPYLADRSQQLELESLRTLDHHNTFLSLLTETGLIGFALFIALLLGWTMVAWRLVRREAPGSWRQLQGLLTLVTLLTYVASALFHDLTLSPTDHWLLFLVAGVSAGLVAQSREAVAKAAAPLACSNAWSLAGT
jgi:O-antigen ligase